MPFGVGSWDEAVSLRARSMVLAGDRIRGVEGGCCRARGWDLGAGFGEAA